MHTCLPLSVLHDKGMWQHPTPWLHNFRHRRQRQRRWCGQTCHHQLGRRMRIHPAAERTGIMMRFSAAQSPGRARGEVRISRANALPCAGQDAQHRR